MRIEKDIVIVGGGLTGLTATYYLKKAGNNVLVVEKADRWGGCIQTIREKGYIFETGPNTGSLSNVETVELFEDLNENCRLETANPNAERRLILKGGRIQDLPSGLVSGLTTALFSWKDKFGILLEPFRKKGENPDESLADLTCRRLGKSYLEYAVDPFVSGIYAGDPDMLATRYAMPKLYNLEQNYGSFIRGAIAKAKEPKSEQEKKVTKGVFSVEGGMDILIKALSNAIGEENMLLNTSIRILKAEKNDCEIEIPGGKIVAKRIVTTTGAHALPELFSFARQELISRINNLRYAPVVQMAVSVSTDAVDSEYFRAFGILLPSKEQRKILGVLYPSVCFQNRCPENRVLLSVFLGGIRHPEMIGLSDNQLEEIVVQELKSIYGNPALKADIIRISRHPYAIPQYEKNTGERLEAITEFEKIYSGILIKGNALDGIGMANRIKQAVDLVKTINIG